MEKKVKARKLRESDLEDIGGKRKGREGKVWLGKGKGRIERRWDGEGKVKRTRKDRKRK